MFSITNLIDSFLKKNGKESDLEMPKLTRAQAKKMIVDYIKPVLQKEGFIYQKGLRFWRICDNKTDVIELRFLLNNDPSSSNLPSSTFSLLAGCYFNFFPIIFEDKALYYLPNLLTPDETHCDLKFTGRPNFHQLIFKDKPNWWHLNCVEVEQAKVLSDVRDVLEIQLLPLINKFDDIKELLSLLESQNQIDSDIGIGKPDSFNRQYLLGFTYLKLEDSKLALQHLNKAKKLLDELLIKVKEPMSLKSEAPLIKQSNNIIQALELLK